MTSISANLARRSLANHGIQATAAQASFESELVGMADATAAGIEEQEQIVADANDVSSDIVTSTNGANALSDLVDNTIAIYGDTGIPQDAAAVLEVSVECVLRSMGMNIPASAILPSFEGKTRIQYSTEAEEKKQSIIDRIWETIKKAFASFTEFLGNIIAKLRNNINSIQAYSKRVRERLDTVKGATPTGELKLGTDGALTKSGEAQTVVANTNTSYKKFVDDWAKHWDALLSPAAVNAVTSGNTEQMRNLLKTSVKMPDTLEHAFTPFHKLTITPGSDAENAVAGAKAKVASSEANKEGSFKYLTETQMKETVDAVDAVLLDLTEVEKDITKWNETLKKIRNVGRFANVAGKANQVLKVETGENAGTVMRKAGQALTGGSRIAIDGFSDTFGPVLRILRSNLVYVAKSAAGYGSDKAKEEDKPDQKPEEKQPAETQDDKPKE